MNFITTRFGIEIQRRKYERQSSFKKRAIYEEREYMKKQLDEIELSWIGYNAVILEHPIKDVEGNDVLIVRYDEKSISEIGMKWKYLTPTFKLVE